MRTLSLLLLTLVLASGASAQSFNWQGTPLYGTVTLRGGFTDDPHVTSVLAGGSTRNPLSGTGCVGYYNLGTPDLDLNYTSSGLLPLTISASADRDISLVIYSADGQWYCDDDSGGNLNPKITLNSPPSGNYNIWVGTYAAGATVQATVGISELGRMPGGTASGNTAASATQSFNWQSTPLNGTVTLNAGFTGDPHVTSVRAGGSTRNPLSGGDCVGYFYLDAPDVDLNYTAGSLPLTISATSGSDISLVVYTPDGQWYCDDDSGGNLDPMITFSSPRSGNYNIWVGTYSSSSVVDATVGISELGRKPGGGKGKL